MIRLLSLILVSFLFYSNTSAQFFIRGGYGLGLCNPHEINRTIYVHNQINSNYYATGKELPKIKTLGGLCIAIGSEYDKNVGWELQWQNRHDVVKSRFEFNGETIERYLKIRSNMLSLGFYGGSDNLAIGGSVDLGNFKGFYKRGREDTIKKADYAYIFQTKAVFNGASDAKEKNMLLTLQVGLTVFAQYTVGPIGARLFYQFQFMPMEIDNIDNRLLGRDIQSNQDLEDHLNNFGVMVFLKLGGYKD